jgi:hypothetical protein
VRLGPAAVLVTPSHGRDAEIDPFPASIGSRVEEPVLTILVGDLARSVGADAGRSAQPASWPPLDLFDGVIVGASIIARGHQPVIAAS